MGSPPPSLTPFPFVYLFFNRHGTPYTIPSIEKKKKDKKRCPCHILTVSSCYFMSHFMNIIDISTRFIGSKCFFSLCDKFPYHFTYFNLRITLEYLNTWSLKKVLIRTTSRNCGMNNTKSYNGSWQCWTHRSSYAWQVVCTSNGCPLFSIFKE